jgi:aspartate/methionine/tyrosine aminotransferase
VFDDGHTGYTEALGIPELRNAIADDYRSRFGINIESSRIAVTSGASGALNLLFSVLLNPGDQVLMSDPGYPCNEAFIRLVGGEPIRMPVDQRTGYQPTVELVKEDWTADTVGVILATPSNPTGAMIQTAQLEAINDFVVERQGFVMVDEIYQGLVYEPDMDEVATSSLAIDPGLIVVNSFSKYFGMTGWRLGWCVVPDLLFEALERAAQNLYIAPSIVAEVLGEPIDDAQSRIDSETACSYLIHIWFIDKALINLIHHYKSLSLHYEIIDRFKLCRLNHGTRRI